MWELMTERIIQVQGDGLVKVEPDWCILLFDLKAQRQSYGEALNELARRTDQLRAALEKCGVARVAARTSDFSVKTEHTYRENERVFQGFTARHSLRVELPLNMEHLQSVFQAVAASDIQAEFDLEFDYSGREALREQALAAAVRQARAHAEGLARAAGVTLGPIVRIHYGEAEPRIESQRFSLESGVSDGEVAVPDMEPAALQISERVTVIWEIASDQCDGRPRR